MKLGKDDFPIVEWGKGHLHVAKNPTDLSRVARSEYNRLKEICNNGDMRIATCNGYIHKILDIRPIKSSILISLFLPFRVENVISEGRLYDLTEFRSKIANGVKTRQIGDFDSSFYREFLEKSENASSYNAIIASIPKII